MSMIVWNARDCWCNCCMFRTTRIHLSCRRTRSPRQLGITLSVLDYERARNGLCWKPARGLINHCLAYEPVRQGHTSITTDFDGYWLTFNLLRVQRTQSTITRALLTVLPAHQLHHINRHHQSHWQYWTGLEWTFNIATTSTMHRFCKPPARFHLSVCRCVCVCVCVNAAF